MAIRQLANAAAQGTVAASITAVQTSITVAGGTFPAILAGGGQLSIVMIDAGAPGYDSNNPLAVGFEYQQVNAIAAGVFTFGPGGGSASRVAYGGTTPRAFSAGAIVAAVPLAEDFAASAPWKVYESAVTVGTVADFTITNIPQTYRELEIDWGAVTDQATGQNLFVRANGDTTGNYNYITSDNVLGGTAPTIQTAALATSVRIGTAGTNIASGRLVIANYAFSLVTPAVGMRQMWGSWIQDTDSNMKGGDVWGEWKNTANALTSLRIFPASGSLKAGSWLRIRANP